MDISWERLNKIFKDGGYEALDEEWDKLFEEFLSTVPEERREKARIKQWAYKRDLNKIKNPIVRFSEASNRMWEAFHKMHEVLNDPSTIKNKEHNAKIYDFRREV